MKRIGLTIASLLVAGGIALAQTPEKIAEHWFNQGNTAYNLGRFDEAAGHFTKAYEAWAQPEFLYNIAQSYRQAGNCKQALFFYKRFKALKEKDDKAPLSAKKRDEVDRFIKQLTECAAKADSAATTRPDTIDSPPPTNPTNTNPTTTTTTTPTPPIPTTTNTTNTTNPTTTSPTTTNPTTTTTTTNPTTSTSPTTTTPTNPTTTAKPKTVGALEPTDGPVDDGGITKSADERPKTLSARMTAGVAMLGNSSLNIPVQPSVGITGGYPIPVGKMTLEVGAGFAWSPLPYQDTAGEQQRGRMIAVRAVGAIVYPVASKVSLRGDLGLGIASLTGLGEGNPVTSMRQAHSFTLPSFRFGIAADYAVTPNVLAYVSPFGIGFSPGNDAMYGGGGLREINVLVGVGYRQ